jgi:hypothetical protein
MRVAWRESAERFMRSFVKLERGAWFNAGNVGDIDVG